LPFLRFPCQNPYIKTPFLCGDCYLETDFSPVSYAAALIQDRDGNVLFIRRYKEPDKGKLGIPGGFVNSGEPLETAVLREVKEEVVIQLDSWKYPGGWPNEYTHKSIVYTVNDVYFLARMDNFQNIQICSDENNGIQIENPDTINTEEVAPPSLKFSLYS
jgi:8-oxo-dGTP pyrophosphatase MutT (NUDIX family)